MNYHLCYRYPSHDIVALTFSNLRFALRALTRRPELLLIASPRRLPVGTVCTPADWLWHAQTAPTLEASNSVEQRSESPALIPLADFPSPEVPPENANWRKRLDALQLAAWRGAI